MDRNKILKRILKKLSPDKTEVDFSMFDSQFSDLKKKLLEKVQADTLDDVNEQLEKFKNKIDLAPLADSIETLKESISSREGEIQDLLESKINEVIELQNNNEVDNSNKINNLSLEINSLKELIKKLQEPQEDKITPLLTNIQSLESRFNSSLESGISQVSKEISNSKESNGKALETEVSNLIKGIEDLRTELLNRMSALGGGSMNRQILIGGVDYLKSYTDINFIAGSGITILAVNDNAKKRVNVTITSSGGGGVSYEEPVGAVNDSNTTFTVSNTPVYIIVNGAQYLVGTGLFTSYSAPTITLSSAVGTGGFIRSAYS